MSGCQKHFRIKFNSCAPLKGKTTLCRNKFSDISFSVLQLTKSFLWQLVPNQYLTMYRIYYGCSVTSYPHHDISYDRILAFFQWKTWSSKLQLDIWTDIYWFHNTFVYHLTRVCLFQLLIACVETLPTSLQSKYFQSCWKYLIIFTLWNHTS